MYVLPDLSTSRGSRLLPPSRNPLLGVCMASLSVKFNAPRVTVPGASPCAWRVHDEHPPVPSTPLHRGRGATKRGDTPRRASREVLCRPGCDPSWGRLRSGTGGCSRTKSDGDGRCAQGRGPAHRHRYIPAAEESMGRWMPLDLGTVVVEQDQSFVSCEVREILAVERDERDANANATRSDPGVVLRSGPAALVGVASQAPP